MLQTEKDLHQGGFAAPFFSDQGVDLALVHGEVNIIVGMYAIGINLMNTARFDDWHKNLTYTLGEALK